MRLSNPTKLIAEPTPIHCGDASYSCRKEGSAQLPKARYSKLVLPMAV